MGFNIASYSTLPENHVGPLKNNPSYVEFISDVGALIRTIEVRMTGRIYLPVVGVEPKHT